VPCRVGRRARLAAQARPYGSFFGPGRHDGPSGPSGWCRPIGLGRPVPCHGSHQAAALGLLMMQGPAAWRRSRPARRSGGRRPGEREIPARRRSSLRCYKAAAHLVEVWRGHRGSRPRPWWRRRRRLRSSRPAPRRRKKGRAARLRLAHLAATTAGFRVGGGQEGWCEGGALRENEESGGCGVSR
jgi:hypothetical protein